MERTGRRDGRTSPSGSNQRIAQDSRNRGTTAQLGRSGGTAPRKQGSEEMAGIDRRLKVFDDLTSAPPLLPITNYSTPQPSLFSRSPSKSPRKICQACGAGVAEQAGFCRECGTSLAHVVEPHPLGGYPDFLQAEEEEEEPMWGTFEAQTLAGQDAREALKRWRSSTRSQRRKSSSN